MIHTVGSFVLGVAFLVFIWNIIKSVRNPTPAPADPWNGATLEWAIPSPPQEFNFAEVPVVHSRDPLWEMKRERGGQLPEPARVSGKAIHMPNPSYWPLVTAIGVLVTLSGFVVGFPYVNLIGAAILLTGIFKWAFEPAG